MRSRLMVICATPPHFNAGMLSADRALEGVLQRNGIDVEVDRRVLYTPLELHQRGLQGSTNDYHQPFQYRSIREEARIDRADALLFWGDFIHSRSHRRDVAQVLAWCGIAHSEEDALALVDRHLFLAEQPLEVLGRSIIFGECLLTETAEARPGDSYQRQLERLFKYVRGAWMRDALSALRVAELRDLRQSHLGVDCGLLLRPEDCRAIAATADDRPRPRAGIFFGRTYEEPSLLLRFAAELVRKLDLNAEWLPWFFVTAMPPEVVTSSWPGLHLPPPADSLPEALGALLACQVVITDSYHLCVQAWNNGIPAICLGRGASHFTTSTTEKKKEIFFLSYGADHFYVFAEELEEILGGRPAPIAGRPIPTDVIPTTLDSLVAHVRDSRWIASIQHRLAVHRDAAEAQLIAALKEVLAR